MATESPPPSLAPPSPDPPTHRQTTTPNTATYDFTPFKDCPAIKAVSTSFSGQLNIVSIPETKIPSPLAPNLAPQTLFDLQEFLIGEAKPGNESGGGNGGGGNGKEVWESWKRAWDLWNNYYIEGRVNEKWIGEEWESIVKGERSSGLGRREVIGVSDDDDEDKDSEPPAPPYRRWRGWRKRTGQEKPTDIPIPLPGRIWELTNGRRSLQRRPTGNKLKRKPGPEIIEANRLSRGEERNTYLEDEEVLADEEVEYLETEDWAEEQWREIDDPKFLKPSMAADSAAKSKTSSKGKRPATTEGSNPKPPKRKHGLFHEESNAPISDDETGDDSSVEENGGIQSGEGGNVQNGGYNQSGGFIAIKDLPDYYEADVSGPRADLRWDDVLQNSVWRPKRIGEKTPKIDLDEDFNQDTDLEVDGGVDCGRSPYPLLRSKIVYTKDEGEHGLQFTKKKIWDGVTGTIFNMPNKPLEPEVEEDDAKIERTKTMYGDYIRNNRHEWQNPDIFPLDIRRVMRVDPKIGLPPPATDIVAVDEELMDSTPEFEPTDLRLMQKDDPWWVVEKQKKARDVPPRRYPPRASLEESTDFLPIDDTCWREQVDFDDNYDARYFITNLHGATLIVNGMEVKKGCVAGPLPPFAVIECPGGQVAFWWGVGGRNWGEGPLGMPEIHWETLRRRPGWGYVGLLAGQVWAMRIADRMKRERTGEDLEDDETWNKWKRAKIEGKSDSRGDGLPGSSRDLIFWSGEGDSLAGGFEDPEDEVRWLYKKAYFEQEQQPEVVYTPVGDAFWPGPHPRVETLETVIGRGFELYWSQHHKQCLNLQRGFAKAQKDTRALKERQEKENMQSLRRKRKADELELPERKRKRLENEATRRKAADEKAAERQWKKDLADKAEKLRKKQEVEAAVIASLILHKPESKHASIKRIRASQVRLKEASDRRMRENANKLRASRGLPLLPPPEDFTTPSFVEFLAKIKESNERKEEQERIRREQERVRQAASENERKKREVAWRLRKQQLDDEAKLQYHQQDIERRRLEHEAQVDAARRRKARDEVELACKARADRYKQSHGGRKPLPPPPPPGGGSTAGGTSTGSKTAAQRAAERLRDDTDRATEQSTRDLEALDAQHLQATVLASLQHGKQFKNHKAAMEARTKVAGKTVNQYVQAEGFDSVGAYLRAEVAPAPEAPHSETGTAEASHVLLYSKYALKLALRKSIEARAKMEGKQPLDVVRDRGGTNLNTWLDQQAEAITAKQIPQPEVPWPILPPNATAAQRAVVERRLVDIRPLDAAIRHENIRLWNALCARIDQASDWETVISQLHDPADNSNPTITPNGSHTIEL